MPKWLSSVHPVLLLVLALVIVFGQLLGFGRGLFVKILWTAAGLVAVVGAIAEWRRK